MTVLANTVIDAVAARFGLEADARLRLGYDVAAEAADALIARAFARDPQGDAERLDAARSAVRRILSEYLEFPA
jgi:hypothetical protein